MSAGKTTTLAIYAAAGAVSLGALVGVGRSMFAPSGAKPCSDRYANSTIFRLERDGVLSTAADIHSRVGGNLSTGLVENAEIMRPRDARIPAAIQIDLRSGPAASRHSAETGPGIAFSWQPRSVQGQAASCVSYNVFFYADLEFDNGGTLPGVQGSDLSQLSKDGFAAHLAWHEDGHPGVQLFVTTHGQTQQTQITSMESKGYTFPRGQWVKIDQEIVLNSPGQDNGILRVWVDGALAIERADIGYRARPEVTVSGVVANVSYGTAGAITWAPSETKIWISPFEIGWQ